MNDIPRPDTRTELVRRLAIDLFNSITAEEVIGGRVIHNVETDELAASDLASEEFRARAVDAYERLLGYHTRPTESMTSAALRSSASSREATTDYFGAKRAIAAILAGLPDDELPELEIEHRADGDIIAWDVEHCIGYGIGQGRINGEPVRIDYRRDAADRAMVLEAVHRAETRWWMKHGAELDS